MSDPARRDFLRWVAASPLFAPALLSTLWADRAAALGVGDPW